MVNTTFQAFEAFRQNLELTQSEKDRVIKSHSYLRSILSEIDNPDIVHTKLHGSWTRSTAIRPINDVDILTYLDPNTCDINWYGNLEGLNPESVLDKLYSVLNRRYSNSSLDRDRPCIVLKLNHCNFDVTPVYAMDDGTYYIPNDTLDGWTKSDPSILQQKLTNVNNANNGKLVPLVKMMKHWNNTYLQGVIQSHELEEFTCDIFSTSTGYFYQTYTINNYPEAIYSWLLRFKQDFYYRYNDYGKSLIETSISIAHSAIVAWNEGDEIMSIKLWNKLFVKPFPYIS